MDILAIDYYTTEFIPVTNIIDEVPVKFSSPPPQAFKCAVVGIKPVSMFSGTCIIFFNQHLMYIPVLYSKICLQ